jgi:signal transduction histidine kinase
MTRTDLPHNGARDGAAVLVVDDNAANRLLAKAVLESGGYDSILAESGERALELFAARPASLVLLDIVMPGMDGFDVFRELRAVPGGEDVPIVIVTGLTDPMCVQRAIELGADDFLCKPVNGIELLTRIRTLLARRRSTELATVTSAELTERERQREQLTTMVVHDLRERLSAIYFNAGMLEGDESLDVKGRERVERILRAAEHMNGLFSNLLDIHESREATLTLALSEFDLAALVGDVASEARAGRAGTNRHTVELEVSAPQRVRGDRDMLRRVLENLLDNSVKYSPPGTTVRLSCCSENGGVALRVTVEGPRIPDEDKQAIFDSAAHAERELVRQRRGLGLAFCRMAVEAHKGQIRVESDGTRGSCFVVTLPCEVG